MKDNTLTGYRLILAAYPTKIIINSRNRPIIAPAKACFWLNIDQYPIICDQHWNRVVDLY